MGFMASDKLTKTPGWAEEIIHLLGIEVEDEHEEEEEEEETPAPFKVNLSSSLQEGLGLRARPLDPKRTTKQRKRVHGIKRKSLIEVKSQVLQKMEERGEIMKRTIDSTVFKVIFIKDDKSTVLRPRDFQSQFYELNETQFNLFTNNVKEELEKDKQEVSWKKKELLEQLNRTHSFEESMSIVED